MLHYKCNITRITLNKEYEVCTYYNPPPIKFVTLLINKMNLRVEKTAYGAKRMPKQKTLSNSKSISILGIPVTYSRHNGKCNFCAFHEEIHAFEDWIFVRLSSLVLASEWTTNRKKVYSLIIDRFMVSEGSNTLILPFTSKRGQSVAQNRQKFFFFSVWGLLVNR